MTIQRIGRTTVRALLIGGALWAAAAAPSGCTMRRPVDVSLAEPGEGWAPRTAVDIRNYHGCVTVIVDRSLTTAQPEAVVRASPPIQSALDSKATESVTVIADWVEQEGGRVLRIRTGTTWPDPDQVWCNLTVRMPSCDGATIWTRGGTVDLVGVSGALQVDNGPMAGSDGTIRVRTSQPMTAPVTLTTSEGSVVYQIAPNSTGAFELAEPEGHVQFDCQTAYPEHLSNDGKSTTARLNKGTNPVVLRSGAGLVRVVVMDKPEQYVNHVE